MRGWRRELPGAGEASCLVCGAQRDWLLLAWTQENELECWLPSDVATWGGETPVELTSICPDGHTHTQLPRATNRTTLQVLKHRPTRSQVVTLWGSGGAGKTLLMRRLINFRSGVRRPGSARKYERTLTPIYQEGIAALVPLERGKVPQRSLDLQPKHASRDMLLEYIVLKTDWPSNEAADFLDSAVTRAGGKALGWGNGRHPVLVSHMVADAKSSTRWRSLQWLIDNPGEKWNETGDQGRDHRQQANVVLWFADVSIAMPVVDRLQDDPYFAYSLRLNRDDAPDDQGMDRLDLVSDRRLQSQNALRSGTDWAGDGDRLGVVMSKVDIIKRLLDTTVGADDHPPLFVLLEDRLETAVDSAVTGLSALAEHCMAPERAHLRSETVERFFNQNILGDGGEDDLARRRRVVTDILRAFGRPDTFWGFVHGGVEQAFRVDGKDTFVVESIGSYQETAFSGVASGYLQLRDVVSTVLASALLDFCGYDDEDEIAMLGRTKSGAERHFLVALVDQNVEPGRRFVEGLKSDTRAGAGVKQLAIWLMGTALNPPRELL